MFFFFQICENMKERKVFNVAKQRIKGTDTEELVKAGQTNYNLYVWLLTFLLVQLSGQSLAERLSLLFSKRSNRSAIHCVDGCANECI